MGRRLGRTLLHVQLVAGPKQAVCGLRGIEISRARQRLVFIKDVTKIPLLKEYAFEWCPRCEEHPVFQLAVLARIEL